MKQILQFHTVTNLGDLRRVLDDFQHIAKLAEGGTVDSDSIYLEGATQIELEQEVLTDDSKVYNIRFTER